MPRCWNCGSPTDFTSEIEVFIDGKARYACSRDCELTMKEPSTLILISHNSEEIPARDDFISVLASAPDYRGVK